MVELFKREGTLWSPLGSTPCTALGAWSIGSPELKSGLQVGTLFTDAAAQSTGNFSPTQQIP